MDARSNLAELNAEARFNEAALAQLRSLDAMRPGLLQNLVDIFERNTGKLVDELEAKVAAGESTSVRASFHTLKGSAGSLGGLRLSKLAAHAETIAGAGDPEHLLSAVLLSVRAEFVGLRAALAQLMAAGK